VSKKVDRLLTEALNTVDRISKALLLIKPLSDQIVQIKAELKAETSAATPNMQRVNALKADGLAKATKIGQCVKAAMEGLGTLAATCDELDKLLTKKKMDKGILKPINEQKDKLLQAATIWAIYKQDVEKACS
jgi:hypothetical protein